MLGILVLSLGLVGVAIAGEQCNKANASSCNQAATKVADASHCPTTAAKADYAYVQEQTGCTATAAAATQHTVAQAAYDKCLSETGCTKTADAEYEKTAIAVAEEIEKHTAEAGEQESS